MEMNRNQSILVSFTATTVPKITGANVAVKVCGRVICHINFTELISCLDFINIPTLLIYYHPILYAKSLTNTNRDHSLFERAFNLMVLLIMPQNKCHLKACLFLYFLS